MARVARPWFWEERRGWYVSVGGQRHHLGAHPDGFPAPRKQRGRWNVPPPILTRFHELMTAPAAPPAAAPPTTNPAVVTVLDDYLEWCRVHRSPRTFEWSRTHIQGFIDSLPDRRLTVDALKPFHVQRWADAKTGWGANHTRGAITAVQRAFNWAEQMGHVPRSPIRRLEKPAPKRREQVLSRTEFDALLAQVKDAAFRDVLEFCWETGCRVQEVRVLEARHYKADRQRFEIPPAEAKGKKRWRVIYLTDRAAAVAAPLVLRHPDGPVFRNTDGNPWDAQNFNCRFVRLKKKLGVKYALTAIRHSFCQRMLEAGVDHTTVAALLGHANAVMVSTTYSHMDQARDFLRDELRRGSGGGAAG